MPLMCRRQRAFPGCAACTCAARALRGCTRLILRPPRCRNQPGADGGLLWSQHLIFDGWHPAQHAHAAASSPHLAPTTSKQPLLMSVPRLTAAPVSAASSSVKAHPDARQAGVAAAGTHVLAAPGSASPSSDVKRPPAGARLHTSAHGNSVSSTQSSAAVVAERNTSVDAGSGSSIHAAAIISDFDWRAYLLRYPDLRASGVRTQEAAAAHYAATGRNEQRSYRRVPLVLQYVACQVGAVFACLPL